MKLLAIAISILCVVFDEKATVQGGAPEDDTAGGFQYIVNIERESLISFKNDFFKITNNDYADSPIEFLQKIDESNALKLSRVIWDNWGHDIYVSENGEKMVDICETSYPERSTEANSYKLINKFFMADKGCPIEMGTSTIPQTINDFVLVFDEKLECGKYRFNINLDTPDDDWILDTSYKFDIEKGVHDCTDESHDL